MEPTSALLRSRTIPVSSVLTYNGKPSFRPFNKHLVASAPIGAFLRPRSPNTFTSFPRFVSNAEALPSFSTTTRTRSISRNAPIYSFRNPSFKSLRTTLSEITPIRVIKWSAVLSLAIAATKWVTSSLLNPFFWMYFSWTWVFWPWFLAVGVAIYGLYCFRKHLRGEASVFEQLAVVTSAFAWLTLVPPAHFNGFLEGWPFVFFFVYHYFFFFNVSVRKRLYGDYYPRPHDPKWDVNAPVWHRVFFCAGVMVGHWFAALEGPELHRIPGGWRNVGIWIMITVTLLTQYHSTSYLAKYSEKVVVPTAVVQFGPYRWVRHPIYASTMLLFVTYSAALRAPLSLLFLVAVCLLYYDQKAKIEESLMVETFGERYREYASRVRCKFIPFLY